MTRSDRIPGLRHGAGFLAAAVMVAGLAQPAGAQSKYKEAPMLAALVASGQLPPIDKRLPTNPRVIDPVEKIGEYGGTWRSGLRGGQDRNWLFRLMGYEPLVAWDREWTGKIVPNLAAEFSANADATEFTFKLRNGIKWSDGQPYTADDIVFFVNDIAKNKDVLPNPPAWLTVQGKPPTIEKIDELTFKIKFPEPYGLFLNNVARVLGVQITMMAKHYCSQFLPSYNPKLADLVKEAGVNTWQELLVKRCGVDTEAPERWQNPARPVLEAWRIRQPYVGGATVVTLERNPYYWKVDPAGNQLPYIDGHRLDVGADVQTLVLKAVAGEIDFQDRHINLNSNKAVFVDNMKRGNYRLVDLPNADMNTMVISLNFTHKDPIKRQIFNNKDFRVGLSHAIDRKAIIDAVFIGQGEPWQGAPRREFVYFHEKLATQYTQYDVKLANEYLDKAGYSKKDGQGFRLGPDGKKISFSILAIPALGDFVDTTQLVVQYWQKVGIDAQLQTVDRTLFYDRKNKAEHDAAVFQGSGGMADGLLDPRWYFPFYDELLYAVPWANWYTKSGTLTEEPPAATKKQMELYEKLKSEANPDQQKALMKEILDIAADQFYVIGISTPPTLYAVVKNTMRNVPSHPWAWIYPSPGPSNTEQYYFTK